MVRRLVGASPAVVLALVLGLVAGGASAVRAADLCARADEPPPPAIQALGVQAADHLARGNFLDARTALGQVIADPGFGRLGERSQGCYLTQDGVVDARLGDLAGADQALAAADQALSGLEDDDPARLQIAMTRGAVLARQGEFDRARTLLDQALARQARAEDNADSQALRALGLLTLATVDEGEGRFADGARRAEESRALAERLSGAKGLDVAAALNVLGTLALRQSDFGSADRNYRAALNIYETTVGLDHPDAAALLGNLAVLDRRLGRFDAAAQLSDRVLRIRQAKLGADHPAVAEAKIAVATSALLAGDLNTAEATYRQAMVSLKRVPGNEATLAVALDGIGQVAFTSGTAAGAVAFFQEALKVRLEHLGADHPSIPSSLINLGAALMIDVEARRAAGQLQNAASDPDVAALIDLFGEALRRREALLGPKHPDLIQVLVPLSRLKAWQGRSQEAVQLASRAASLALDGVPRLAEAGVGPAERGIADREVFENLAVRLAESGGPPPTFEALQRAQASRTASAVEQMALRFAADRSTLGSLISRRQQAIERLRVLDKAIDDAARQPLGGSGLGGLRAQLSEASDAVRVLDGELARSFPAFAELAKATATPVPNVQRVLAADEAVLSWLLNGNDAWLWVLRRDRSQMVRLPAGALEIDRLAIAVRRPMNDVTGGIGAFDTHAAHQLFNAAFAPALPLLAGARHIMVVPDGALGSLPLALLVTKPSVARGSDYSRIPFLARDYAFTTLPSVSSLVVLRSLAGRSAATAGFIGFGDPVLTRANATGPIGAILKTLPELPETADELRAIAGVVGGTTKVDLGQAFSRRAVLSTPLKGYRVIAFATHGAMADEIPGVPEPSLVTTPQGDNGLLAASELARLSLDADWVVLSACNTAAPDGTPGAEGLSGLARAFAYAGARSLLVSHWAVASDTTVLITTGLFQRLQADPRLSRAEALRQSILAVADNPATSHPLFWAPFVVVGEGAR
ncbi:CHAT domain-containing tetratricopeptide repeat protein [Zavarzinia sp. CC-PAN008]|uniref:CHAT domain-containing tetratricopeptide repeat protein n=1 Tax=Zavarzinia sp. CC-PAN008 TaxID=3243332 RepID=UPI003F748DC5